MTKYQKNWTNYSNQVLLRSKLNFVFCFSINFLTLFTDNFPIHLFQLGKSFLKLSLIISGVTIRIYWNISAVSCWMFCWWIHWTIVRTGITCKKIFHKSLLNSTYRWSIARLAINKKEIFLITRSPTCCKCDSYFWLRTNKGIKANL